MSGLLACRDGEVRLHEVDDSALPRFSLAIYWALHSCQTWLKNLVSKLTDLDFYIVVDSFDDLLGISTHRGRGAPP